jgi:hypothetical protein
VSVASVQSAAFRSKRQSRNLQKRFRGSAFASRSNRERGAQALGRFGLNAHGYQFAVSTAERVVIVAAFAVVLLVGVLWLARSFRRGGLGPPMTMAPVTKAGRRRVNASYEKHGWAKPFDEEGNLLPADKRGPPDGG